MRVSAPLALSALLAVGCGTDTPASDEDAALDASAADTATGDVSADDVADEDGETDAADAGAEEDAEDDTADVTAPDAGEDVDDIEEEVTPDAGDTCPGDRLPYFGDDGNPIEIPIDGQAIMLGTWDGREGVRYLLDTGAQITSYDIDLTDGAVTFFTAGITDLGTTVLCDVPSKGRDLAEAEAYIGVNIDALLGQSALRDAYMYIDYETERSWVYDNDPFENGVSAPPGSVALEDAEAGAPAVMPYELQNELPVATMTLTGGVEVALLTDTGSGVTLLERSFFDAMEAAHGEPLPRLEGYVWATNFGTDESFITRIPSMDVGGRAVEGEWAVVVPDDNHIAALLEGSGVFVDGFLGYPVYRQFVTEVRGPETEFRFWPTASDTAYPDEWHRVGLELVQRDGVNIVEMIFSPSSVATSEIALHDVLLSVDGASVDGLGLDAIRRLLRGTPGEERALTLQRAESEETYEVTVLVDDLLPPL